MNPRSNPARALSFSRCAFTLVELLVVVAIIAVVGTGVAVTYGRKTIDASKDQLTLHEMHEIKKAFLRFHSDNYLRLQREFADHKGASLPSTDFRSSLSSYSNDDASKRFYGQMDFYETYGLWFLMLPRISGASTAEHPEEGYKLFPEFVMFSAVTGDGWNGPYLDVNAREAWTYDAVWKDDPIEYEGIDFPQIADKHGGHRYEYPIENEPSIVKPLDVYRLLYYEHQEPSGGTIYRRLLLVAPRGNANADEIKAGELLDQTGTRRRGADRGRLNLHTGTFSNDPLDINDDEDESASPFFVLEFLNMDKLQ